MNLGKEINFIFKENPELKRIGTKKEYSKYIKQIFPNTKLKNIFYHHSHEKLEKFKSNFVKGYAAQKGVSPKAIFFLGNPAKKEFLSERKYLILALLDIQKPFIYKDKNQRGPDRKSGINESVQKALKKGNDGVILKNIWDNKIWTDVYVVFNSNQIHILGSKQDIKQFEDYKKNRIN